MSTNTTIHALSFRDTKTYILAALFVVGNIVFPQLCHLYPQGGFIMLPIYFFTLIAAYKYGWKVGLLTAILSPLCNSMLFAMPAPQVLPILLFKSTVLAIAAAIVAKKVGVTLLGITIAVVAYQLLGGIVEWAITGSLSAACSDIWLGYPGIMLQILGGYCMLKYLLK